MLISVEFFVLEKTGSGPGTGCPTGWSHSNDAFIIVARQANAGGGGGRGSTASCPTTSWSAVSAQLVWAWREWCCECGDHNILIVIQIEILAFVVILVLGVAVRVLVVQQRGGHLILAARHAHSSPAHGTGVHVSDLGAWRRQQTGQQRFASCMHYSFARRGGGDGGAGISKRHRVPIIPIRGLTKRLGVAVLIGGFLGYCITVIVLLLLLLCAVGQWM